MRQQLIPWPWKQVLLHLRFKKAHRLAVSVPFGKTNRWCLCLCTESHTYWAQHESAPSSQSCSRIQSKLPRFPCLDSFFESEKHTSAYIRKNMHMHTSTNTTAEHGCLNNREGFLHRSELPLSHTASRRKLHIP